MSLNRFPLALVVSAAAIVASIAPGHAAGIQDDIEECHVAALEAGLIEDAKVRLRFVADEGNRDRTLTLKALSDTTEPMMIDCKMKRSKVLAVVPAA